MNEKSAEPPGSVAQSILGPEAVFEGVLSFRGAVRLEGRLRGDVIAQGLLRIEPRGRVEGRIEVDELIVAGVLDGDVHARRRVELLPTARVRGAVRTPALSLAEGCVLDGRCHAGAPAAPTDGHRPELAAP